MEHRHFTFTYDSSLSRHEFNERMRIELRKMEMNPPKQDPGAQFRAPGRRTRREKMKEFALIERVEERPTMVYRCWSHGDDCPYVAGTCPDMASDDCEFTLEPIDTYAITHVPGVIGGRSVVTLANRDEIPEILREEYE